MPRKSKGPRLWFRKAGKEWIIRDDETYQRTGCSESQAKEAEGKLAEYIQAKWKPDTSNTSPGHTDCAAVIMIYLDHRLPITPRPQELVSICERLNNFWGGKMVSKIIGDSCRAFTKQSSTDSMARHDLEILRAAVRHYRAEFGLDFEPAFTLPPKGNPRKGWLTRPMAARLLLAAHRGGHSHLVRFLLIGLYTGTRAGAILDLQWFANTTGGYIDLERGVIYRATANHKETNKRKPPITIPNRLRPHLVRWQKQDSVENARTRHVVRWHGNKVASIKKSFKSAREAAELPTWAIPHCLRHTSITWAMHSGVDPMEACGFFGVTMRVMQSTYLHHHPNFQSGIRKAF